MLCTFEASDTALEPVVSARLEKARSALQKATRVVAYTDGACSGNPGPGGWGALLYYSLGKEPQQLEVWGGAEMTTNNRMELLAAIRALELLPPECGMHIYTDSQYLQKGMTEWLAGWQKKNWRSAGGKPVRNADLWRGLNALSTERIQWSWVRGHAGVADNERADALARRGLKESLGAPDSF